MDKIKKNNKLKSNKNIVNRKTEEIWINPVGGYGDILMLSGVLKQVYDKNPSQKFNLVHRTKYSHFLKDNPAIKCMGYPPKGAIIIGSDYWSKNNFESGKYRAFQSLAERFGLKTPVEEKLFLSGNFEEDKLLYKIIPWKKKNVLIAPSSDSPRKMMHPMAWHNIVEKLTSDNVFVLQAGTKTDIHIRGTYSLLNLTSPRQLISLIKKCNFVICPDNFIMHAAHLVEKPAIVVWGPSKSSVYGYAGHIHIHAPMEHCEQKDKCIGPTVPHNYSTMCPLGDEQCMKKIPVEKILNAAYSLL